MYLMLFLPYYIRWHYTRAWTNLFENWTHWIVFLFTFFSIPVLLKTLLTPWRKLGAEKHKSINMEDFFSSVVVNVLMRLLGFVIRLLVILIGVVVIVCVGVLGVAATILWAVFPLALPFVLVLSVMKFTNI